MTNCTTCSKGEYHGFRRDGYHSTIFFWCPIRKSHVSHRIDECPDYSEGTPGRFDAKGERIG